MCVRFIHSYIEISFKYSYFGKFSLFLFMFLEICLRQTIHKLQIPSLIKASAHFFKLENKLAENNFMYFLFSSLLINF